MIKKLRIHNFRTYLNAEFELENRHLLIGKNNSGKTNLVSAIRFLGACGCTDLSNALTHTPSGIYELRNWSTKDELTEFVCECNLELDEEMCNFTYELALRLVPSPGVRGTGQLELGVDRELLWIQTAKLGRCPLIDNNGREAKLFHEEKKQGDQPYQPKTLAPKGATMLSKLYELDTNRRAILFRKFLSNWIYYRLNPESMRTGWHGRNDIGLSLAWNGENLANVLFQLKNRDETRYRRLVEHVQIVEPNLVALNFQTTPDQGITPFVEHKDRQSATWIGLSDGTLRMLAICYLIEIAGLYPNSSWPAPTLMLIEEPENGIAPAVLSKLYDLFEECAPRGQFIFTSHSPYFIDQFDSARNCVTLIKKRGSHTEAVSPPPVTVEDADPDRLTLAEQYSSELLD